MAEFAVKSAVGHIATRGKARLEFGRSNCTQSVHHEGIELVSRDWASDERSAGFKSVWGGNSSTRGKLLCRWFQLTYCGYVVTENLVRLIEEVIRYDYSSHHTQYLGGRRSNKGKRFIHARYPSILGRVRSPKGCVECKQQCFFFVSKALAARRPVHIVVRSNPPFTLPVVTKLLIVVIIVGRVEQRLRDRGCTHHGIERRSFKFQII